MERDHRIQVAQADFDIIPTMATIAMLVAIGNNQYHHFQGRM